MPRSGRRPERGTRGRYARLFISPATGAILLLTIFPLIFSLGLTFLNVNLFRRIPIRFVGFENWTRLFNDSAMAVTMFNTMLFVVVGVAIQYVLGLGLALLLNQGLRGQRA
ncbi:MAG: sugar ABC transporter permease, partial [Acidimicrobiia bacterium]